MRKNEALPCFGTGDQMPRLHGGAMRCPISVSTLIGGPFRLWIRFRRTYSNWRKIDMAREPANGETIEKNVVQIGVGFNASVADLDPAALGAALPSQSECCMGWWLLRHARPLARLQPC